MAGAIGEVLPLALGVAISPIPAVAMTGVLLGARPRLGSYGFITGWVLGLSVLVTVSELFTLWIPDLQPGAPHPLRGPLRIVLGCLLALAALKEWQQRSEAGETPEAPRWLEGIEMAGPLRLAGLAFVLAVLSPKNLLLAAGAGLAIWESPLAAEFVTMVLFVMIGSLAVVVPLLVARADDDLAVERLERLRLRLLHHRSATLTVVLAVLALVMVGRGIAAF